MPKSCLVETSLRVVKNKHTASSCWRFRFPLARNPERLAKTGKLPASDVLPANCRVGEIKRRKQPCRKSASKKRGSMPVAVDPVKRRSRKPHERKVGTSSKRSGRITRHSYKACSARGPYVVLGTDESRPIPLRMIEKDNGPSLPHD